MIAATYGVVQSQKKTFDYFWLIKNQIENLQKILRKI